MAFILVFVTATILASSITYCVMAKQPNTEQQKTKVKQPEIIHAEFNDSILNSETALSSFLLIFSRFIFFIDTS